ncbi:MAG: pilus (MSHA type) biogenesis protein MshL [Gammaproteobacteria bacterium]|nr:pilus (MSHA type) biogenesis protein MshL [Gammaproteobacteria bacterium]
MKEIYRVSIYAAAGFLLAACSVPLVPVRDPSPGHLTPQATTAPDTIPAPVGQVPILPPPRPAPRLETYTVVVNDVPARDLLFALARDAKVNVDISPGLTGNVTLNAIDQTLPQILERLSEQMDLRYTIQGNLVTVGPDAPYLHTYKVDYVNMARETQTSIQVASQVASTTPGGGQGGGGGGTSGSGGANSTTNITNTSINHFWESLAQNILNILGEKGATGGGSAGKVTSTSSVIVNPESGVLTVRATARQHRVIADYLGQVLASAHRQVLIEATVVEVELSDQYEAGVDWTNLAKGSGFLAIQNSPSVTNPFFTLSYLGPGDDIYGTIRLLSQYGQTRVLSSPKLMVLNNQSSVLKVVRNVVYFQIDVTNTLGTTAQPAQQQSETNIYTVPVGLVMNVTPQISESEQVILNVRPSISSIVRFVQDPNPSLYQQGLLLDTQIQNLIPEVETREMESVLRVSSGQVAVLGGLMKDEVRRDQTGVPFLKDIPILGNAFSYRSAENIKSELVIFIRPVVVRDASIETDLRELRPFLDQTAQPNLGLPATLGGERINESITGRP